MKRAKSKIIYWTAADVKAMRKLATKKSARDIGKQLRRSEVAVRLKASQLGISLRLA